MVPLSVLHAAGGHGHATFQAPPWLAWVLGGLVVAVSFTLVAATTLRGTTPPPTRWRLPLDGWPAAHLATALLALALLPALRAALPQDPALLLAGALLALLASYALAVQGVRRLAPTLQPHDALAGAFAPTLLPIVIGSLSAYGLTWTPWSVQVPPLWVVTAQVLLVVTAHVVAVLAAHRVALRRFPGRVQALRAEAPLTLLMVAYTVAGLSLVTAAGGIA